jgi:hypothetical protein
MCIEWKDGTTSWETLASLKESYPVQVAEYALAAGISDEPAFKWWVPHILKKRDRIIAKIKTIPQENPQIWIRSSENSH